MVNKLSRRDMLTGAAAGMFAASVAPFPTGFPVSGCDLDQLVSLHATGCSILNTVHDLRLNIAAIETPVYKSVPIGTFKL